MGEKREQSLQLEGEKIARQLGNGVTYHGPWLPYGHDGEFLGHFFQDDAVTMTSFVCYDLEDCKADLIRIRQNFEVAPPHFSQENQPATPPP